MSYLGQLTNNQLDNPKTRINTTTEYKDKEGRVVGRDVAGRLTLYAYDALGQLRCVLPPMAVMNLTGLSSFDPITTPGLKDLVFVYGYDNRGRMVSKKVPGAGLMTMAYDTRDRLTTTTDARNNAIATTYDNLDRVISTSVVNGQMLTENYYGTTAYAGYKSYSASLAYNQTPKTTNLAGMLTGSRVWVLGAATSSLLTTYHYDVLGRTIQTSTDNHLGGVDVASSKPDFVGRVLESKQLTNGKVSVDTRTSYDRAGRVKMVCQQVADDQTTATGKYWEPVARHSYNALGELSQKTLGCELQNINYSYQMRGWLTGLNNPDKLVGASGQIADQNFFGMRLGYDGIGNINTWAYRSAQKQGTYTAPFSLTLNPGMSYSFGYDNLNRLTSAGLSRSGTSVFTLTNTYDHNGNIQNLTRSLTGVPGAPLTDNLAYTYLPNNNQLANVSDNSPSPGKAGFFTDGTNTAPNDDYAYDATGNLTKDLNKGIANIAYNLLNLPQTVTTPTGPVNYTYTAGGQKLRATFPGTPAKTYDYVGGLVYEGGKLEFVPTAEGRVLPPGRAVNPALTAAESYSNTFPRHEYHLKDHLGNLRVACRCAEVANAISPSQGYGPVVVQEEQYDPWGLSLPGLSSLTVTTPSRFKYIGREEQQGLGWIDLMARQYDAQTGRFTGVDPMADHREWLTPYNMAQNNPINRIDPDGALDEPLYRKAWNYVSNFFKGADAGTNQRYQTEPARGATVTGIRDTQGGKVRNGGPVGVDVVRIDNPHGSVKTPHINVNPTVTGVPDPHTPISTATLKTLEGTGKTIDAIGKIAKPVAVATDVIRIGLAVNADGGTIGNNTIKTTASVAGGWAGALGGAALGAKGGAVVGSFFGPGPGTAVGGFVGGIGGGLIGSFGGSWLSEKAVGTIIEKK